RLADIVPRAEVPVLTSRLHVLSPEVLAGELVAVVNWVRLADIVPRAEVPVLTSRLHVLSPEVLAGELVA
ncbi:hypothetical protein CTI14_71740, partial [Methylobacterium radiotolerans]